MFNSGLYALGVKNTEDIKLKYEHQSIREIVKNKPESDHAKDEQKAG